MNDLDEVSLFSNLNFKEIEKAYLLLINGNQDEIVGEVRKELIKLIYRIIVLHKLINLSNDNELRIRLFKLEAEMEEIRNHIKI